MHPADLRCSGAGRGWGRSCACCASALARGPVGRGGAGPRIRFEFEGTRKVRRVGHSLQPSLSGFPLGLRPATVRIVSNDFGTLRHVILCQTTFAVLRNEPQYPTRGYAPHFGMRYSYCVTRTTVSVIGEGDSVGHGRSVVR